MRHAIVLVLIVVTSAALHAAEVRVAITAPSGDQSCLDRAMVVATPERADGTAVEATTLTRTGAQKSATLDLSSHDVWEVRAAAEGCWSTTAVWRAPDEPVIAIEVFPAATLRGEFAGGAGALRKLRAQAFRLPPATRGRTAAAERDPEPLACTLDFPKWQCTIPSQLPIDVRLEPEGFAPVYAWSIVATPREIRETDRYPLVAGSSLAGWVEAADGSPLPDAAVTLARLEPVQPEPGRTAPLRYSAKTNARGFFQLTGIEPGEYRLSSRAIGYAPVVVPALTVRPATALTWPRSLTHAPPVELRVSIDPPTARDGAAWRVRLTERIALIPGELPRTVGLDAGADGLWIASGLRSDRYELTVHDAHGALIESREVDLSNGAAALALTIRSLDVTGVVKLGDEPFAGVDVRFLNDTGKTVLVTTDEDGEFGAAFPSPGRWRPTVYPKGRNRGAQVRAEPVEIAADGPRTLEIVLPGGRLRGRVVKDGQPVKAAVHVARGGTLAAQELTQKDGSFDFAGLRPGTYSLTAEGDSGTTPRPVEVVVRDGATTEIDVAVEGYSAIRATVLAPNGQPASGAIARISTDGGIYWSDVVLNVRGEFEYFIPRGLMALDVIFLTYSYPAARARLSPGRGPVAIKLQPQGGKLRVKPDGAYLIRDGVAVPVHAFYPPANIGVMPVAHLESGSYAVCPEPRLGAKCKEVVITPGSSAVIQLEKGEK